MIHGVWDILRQIDKIIIIRKSTKLGIKKISEYLTMTESLLTYSTPLRPPLTS